MRVLGIDTSNYATSLAVVDATAGEVVRDSKRFLPVKQGELGLRQSDAVFHHTQALPELLEKLDAETPLREIACIGVSEKPRPVSGSYMPCFLVGLCAAQAMSLAAGVPLVRTTHQQGHMAAALFATGEKALFERTTLVFHISGGTTDLLLCREGQVLQKVAGSLDLYAGQAVDRVGVKLGLPFPAGEALSALAAQCGDAVKPKISMEQGNCHLSGLENQCGTLLQRGAEPAYVAKYCLCAIARTVLAMLEAAALRYPDVPVICAGGVMSSACIRAEVQRVRPDVLFVPPKFASDNAIGVAVLAAREVGAWR